MTLLEKTDVLIVGAGPVGLVTALSLARQGINTIVIEKRDNEGHKSYGRAVTINPRTLETLEQLGVADDFLQIGCRSNGMLAYRNGQQVSSSSLLGYVGAMRRSFHNYQINVRQKIIQNVLAGRYEEVCGEQVHYQHEFEGFVVDTARGDGCNITATVRHPVHGTRTIRCKYLVGADGNGSRVRDAAGIAMVGEDTPERWVRVDGVVKTDVPELDVGVMFFQKTGYAFIFMMRLDGGTTRFGFALTPALIAKYPNGPTVDECIHEAKLALDPFTLEFERIDWHTIYTIKQRLAETLCKDGFVYLAGDAAHVHSSGIGQGMNLGMCDAANLAWKLAGAIKGWYKPAVLDTYGLERRAIAARVVAIDQKLSQSMSGNIPEEYRSLGLDNREVAEKIMSDNADFSIGPGVGYEGSPSVLVKKEVVGALYSGIRIPDFLVQLPGPAVPIRLHSLLHQDTGTWNVLILAGCPASTRERVGALRERFSDPNSVLVKRKRMFRTFTIMVGEVDSVWDAFQGPPIGKLVFDLDCRVHRGFIVSQNHGAIVLVRPDGYVGTTARLEHCAQIESYIEDICV